MFSGLEKLVGFDWFFFMALNFQALNLSVLSPYSRFQLENAVTVSSNGRNGTEMRQWLGRSIKHFVHLYDFHSHAFGVLLPKVSCFGTTCCLQLLTIISRCGCPSKFDFAFSLRPN